MLDINYIKDNLEAVKLAAKNKNIEVDLDRLVAVDGERKGLIGLIENARAERKKNGEKMKDAGEKEREVITEEGKKIKEKIAQLEEKFGSVKEEFDFLMAKVPTVPSEDTPVGKDSDGNVEVSTWGEKPEFDFKPLTHIELGEKLDLLDLQKGTKVAGYRGYYLKNEAVTLVMGVMFLALQKMIARGYTPFIPPTLVKGFSLFGSGYFKGLEYDPTVDEIYQLATSGKEATGEVSKEKKFLIGTAEPTLLAYFSDETLPIEKLPIKVCGFSQCYRSEIGSYGKDTKGIYRVHEFMKVEQVAVCPADLDKAKELQAEMVGISEELHRDLGLPYRKLQICTGDMSAGKYRAFDLEAWMPGLDRYGETGSASNFVDWQARRLNVKYSENGEKKYVYLLNNTALASARTLIAILENYQQKDGSVKVPEVLQSYVGKTVIRAK